MQLILNRARVLLLIISAIFSFYSLNFYEGSKYVFFTYNFILILLTYYLTNFSNSFFSFFLGFYIFMGFWFKYNLSLVFNNGYVFDSGLMKSNNIDEVLVLSSYLFITILLSVIFSSRFQYDKNNIEYKKNIVSDKYFKYKIIFIIFFLTIITINGSLNYYLKIYIKGLIFDKDLNLVFVSIIKWLLLYGLAIFSCFIINLELRKNNPKIILFILLVFFELFISYTSMLSRAILLFGLPFLYSFIFFENKNKNFTINYLYLIITFLLFSILSIYISNHLRINHVNLLKDEVREKFQNLEKINNQENNIQQDKITQNNKKITNFENSKKFDFQVNEILVENPSGKINAQKVTSFIFINRWVGIDSLINVSKSKELGFQTLIDAFKESKIKVGNSFYETRFSLENKKPSFSSNNIYVKGNTLPGLFTFLYYTGSKFFLLFFSFTFIVFFIYLEKKIFFVSNKNLFFVAFFSHCIVNRIFSFGYAPKHTYLFVISLILSVIFIYFLETNRFDKRFNNLK